MSASLSTSPTGNRTGTGAAGAIQQVGELAGVRSSGGHRLQSRGDGMRQLRRQARGGLGQWQPRLARSRRKSGEGRVADGSHAVDVTGRGRGRAAHTHRVGVTVRTERFGTVDQREEPQVSEQGPAVGGEQDRLGRDVAMDEAAFVCGMERLGHGRNRSHDLSGIQTTATGQQLVETASLSVVEDDDHLVAVGQQLAYPQHVRMVEEGEQGHQSLGVRQGLGGAEAQALQRHLLA